MKGKRGQGWPLHDYADMAEGLEKYLSLKSTGPNAIAFASAFPGFEYKINTVSLQVNLWKGASEGVKEEFGRRQGSTWADFRSAVRRTQ